MKKQTGIRLFAAAFVAAAVAAEARARASFVLPERIYAAPGLECNIYYKGIFDSVVPQNYAFQTYSPKGRAELTRWCWTPEAKDAGASVPVVINAWNDDGIAASVTTTVVVASAPANPSRKLTLALFAASQTNCRYQDRVLADMRAAGFANYTPVGSRRRDDPAAAAHDGYGGFTCTSFLTRYKVSDEEVAHLQDAAEREQLKALGMPVKIIHDYQRDLLRSPLVAFRDGRKEVDIPAWMEKVNGGNPPDVVVIDLGVNAIFKYTGEEKELRARMKKELMPTFAQFIETLKPHMPNARFAICNRCIGCSQDGFGVNYGASWNEVQYKKTIFAMNREFEEFVKTYEGTKLDLVPMSHAIDPVYSYIRAPKPAHSHSTEKVLRDQNAVHPSAAGGAQLGDAVAAWLQCRWDELCK